MLENYQKGKEKLNNDDNEEWIRKVSCFEKKDKSYSIYIFLVIIENEEDLKTYYETITASIATEFQVTLDKKIEMWNIYLIFESSNYIGWDTIEMVEQDKYAVRKMVWDELEENELGNADYIDNRLFGITLNGNKITMKDRKILDEIIQNSDMKLYNILQNSKLGLDEKVELYLGEQSNE